MVRKSYSTMILAATAALVMMSCGKKEDLTDLQDTWTKKEGDVIAKLTDVKNKNQELHTKFGTVQAANITDTAKLADRSMVETMLGDHDTQIGDIEKTINTEKANRDSAALKGTRADFEAAWKAAETDYDAALAKISSLDSQNGEIGSKIDGLSSASATTPKDTAVTAPGKTTDSATAAASMDKKMPAEDAKKMDKMNDTAKTAESKTAKKDTKKDVSK